MEKTLGQRISSLRRAKGLTQEKIAVNLGISPQAVSKWERDVSCPDITLLPPLVKLLGITVDELLSGEATAEIADAENRMILSLPVGILWTPLINSEKSHEKGSSLRRWRKKA